MSKEIIAGIDAISEKLHLLETKMNEEVKFKGHADQDTLNALKKVGDEQHDFAKRLLALEQRGALNGPEGNESTKGDESYGARFVKDASYSDFLSRGMSGRFRVELKNTVTNTVGNTFSERRPGIVSGSFRDLTIEDILVKIPTSSNAIDYVQEATFTNNAAEVAEGAIKPESSITFLPQTMPVATVAHWIKISKQLAADNPALAALINTRMVYGVNLKVENQLIAGNGTAPNISGLTKAGNFTAHGYTSAALTGAGLSATNRFDLIGKMIGDSAASDWKPDAILLNPVDWWSMTLAKDTTGRYILGGPQTTAQPFLWGLPVVVSNAVPIDNVMIGSFSQAATFHDRSGIELAMSDSDGDNFQRNLITIRAERRCALTVERPAAIRYGDLTPA